MVFKQDNLDTTQRNFVLNKIGKRTYDDSEGDAVFALKVQMTDPLVS